MSWERPGNVANGLASVLVDSGDDTSQTIPETAHEWRPGVLEKFLYHSLFRKLHGVDIRKRG
jgi:hypothetical protein